MTKTLPALFLLTSMAACSGGGDGGPKNANVDGTWAGSATNVSGSGVSCSASGVVLNLTQTGATFTGNYTVATIKCMGPGGTNSSGPGAGTVVNGTVATDAVAFNLDTQDFHFTDSVSGNSMSGTTTWVVDLGAPTGVVTLTGNWAAARQ